MINKIDSAYPDDVDIVRENIRAVNPDAVVIDAASPITVDDPSAITGARVLIVEDGPTLTHGEMEFGAGFVAAEKFGAEEYVDPRPFAVGTIIDTYEKYYADREDAYILPAMGYGDDQMKDLQQTINASDCDTVIIATPIDLTRVIKITKPVVRVGYELQEIGKPDLPQVLRSFTV